VIIHRANKDLILMSASLASNREEAHLDIRKLVREVFDTLSAAEDGDHFDLGLLEAPICKHAEGGHGGAPGRD
jgi:hypothetical protein